MELSIFIAKIIAVTYIAISFGQLFSGISYEKMYQDIMKSSGLMVMIGLFGIIIGFLLIEYHNIWVKDWPVIITIIGWAAVIKGCLFLAFPKVLKIFEPLFTGKFLKVFPYFTLAFGILFAYFGFFI
ncbi:hypothetical protein ACFL21_02110 [Patescibacteria group bacterium]